MICPILSQSTRDGEGNVTWDHHECIQDACTFWAGEISDCGIRASGLEVLARSKEPPPALDASVLEPVLAAIERSTESMRGAGIKILEGVSALEEPLSGTGRELGSRIESLNEAILGVTTTVEGRVSRITGEIASMRDAVQAASAARPDWAGELTRRLEEMAGEIAGLKRVQEALSDSLGRETEERRRDGERRRMEEARAINARGVGLYHDGAAEAAEAAFRAALDLDPDLAEAHNNLGLALSRQGKEEEAEAAFRRALELRPDLAEAVNNLGFLCHRGGRFERAVELFRRSALSARDSSLAYTNLGNACYGLERFEEAVEAWRTALERDPANEAARTALRMFQQER